MFGLCLPTGETYLVLNDNKKRSIMISDEIQPRKNILENKYVLQAIQAVGYENVNSIVYERNNKKVKVSMAEYYYENADKLKEEVK